MIGMRNIECWLHDWAINGRKKSQLFKQRVSNDWILHENLKHNVKQVTLMNKLARSTAAYGERRLPKTLERDRVHAFWHFNHFREPLIDDDARVL